MACGQCGYVPKQDIMIPMQPGHDGQPWELCVGCYVEGRQPWKLGMFKAPTVIEDPHLADALAAASKRTAGLIDMTDAEDPKPKTRSRPKRP